MRERDIPMIQRVKSLDARQRWGKLLTLVLRKEARIVVEKNGVPVAAVVSMDDLARLTTLERGTKISDAALSKEELEAALAANRAEAGKTRTLLARPSPEEIERRQALLAEIRANRPNRVIAPVTTSELIHAARAQEEQTYGRPR